MQQIREEELMTKGLKICENCEWCVPYLNCEFPHCLLTRQQVGLIETCEHFKWRTANHITM